MQRGVRGPACEGLPCEGLPCRGGEAEAGHGAMGLHREDEGGNVAFEGDRSPIDRMTTGASAARIRGCEMWWDQAGECLPTRDCHVKEVKQRETILPNLSWKGYRSPVGCSSAAAAVMSFAE